MSDTTPNYPATSLAGRLDERLAAAFRQMAGEEAPVALRRSQHADYQADGALALARRLGTSPRALAARILEITDLSDLCARTEIAGPGFINLTLRDDVIAADIAAAHGSSRLGVPETREPETVVVDYSAPNVAKEMHVGHLRSTVIGDAAVRLFDWLGHRVIRANHIGDWGTPFGMLIEHLRDSGGAQANQELSLGDLDAFYKAARRKFDADEVFAERARRRVVLLQAGDPETLAEWRMLVDLSESYFMTVYRLLDVTLTPADFAGESSYNDMLEPVVEELAAKGLLQPSEGALCVFPEGFTGRDDLPLPLVVKKSDGGFGYAATDLAAIRHRVHELGATRIVYVVGLPQHTHLAMIFAVARSAGWLKAGVLAEHIGFGSVLGEDGRMLRSRTGESVKLIELIKEATARAAGVVGSKNPSMAPEAKEQIASIVGIGALKYADLATDRSRDYVFDWDRMLSFDGNTAPYLQYAHARIRSIGRRAGEQGLARDIRLGHAAERALALELSRFRDVVSDAERTLEFHRLAAWLYAVATLFSTFYEQCPVLNGEAAITSSRLTLCDVTARTLATGLWLLGIEAPEQM